MYKYVKWKGVLALIISCTFTDYFLLFNQEAHLFMHTVSGFALAFCLLSLIFFPLLELNGILIAFVGIMSHALGDFVEKVFPNSNIEILGMSFNVSFIVSLVPLILLVMIYMLKFIEPEKRKK
jgi:hypothetical protein